MARGFAAAAAAAALVGSVAAQPYVTLAGPPMGTANDVTGRAINLPLAASNYKGVLLVSGDNGATWWDKMHSYYLVGNPVPNPGEAQGAGIPLNADGSFTWTKWASSPYDNVASQMRFLLLPTSFDTRWPQYQVEGIPLPANLLAAAVAEGSVDRNTGQPLASVLSFTPASPPTAAATAPPAATVAPGGGGGAVSLTFTTPAIPQTTPISGTVTGLANPTGYRAVMYVEAPEQVWWGLKSQASLNPDGSFTLQQWATDAHDPTEAMRIHVFIIPASYTAPQVLGAAQFPAPLVGAAVVDGEAGRGATGSGTGTGGGGGGAVATPTVAATTGATSPLAITAPPLGSVAAVTGTYSGANPSANAAFVFVTDAAGAIWGPKARGAVAGDGTFTINNWATDPNDMNGAASIIVVIAASTYNPPLVLGATALPAGLQASALASAQAQRGASGTGGGTAPGGGGGGGTTGGNTGVLQFVINVPPMGSTGAITGVALNTLQPPSDYVVIAFAVDGGGNYYGPKAQASLAADGSFAVNGWANYAGDANVPSLAAFLMPAGMAVPAVNGGQSLPPNIMSAQKAYVVQSRSAAQPALPAPSVWTTPAATAAPTPVPGGVGGGGGELTWPPVADPGGKVGAQGGYINWSGFRWQVKDSGGGAVGPGPNVFVGDTNFVWTDGWGAHLNVRPRYGCGGWASSEITLDRSLGYGTYMFSTVGPVEFLDPQVTWGLFLWDDNAGEGIGWREIDFEYARWGNGGDPTSSQFVLEPLRPGNLPGWKVRFRTSQARKFGGENGNQGGGGCNDDGQTNFNGASVNRMTCALNWGQGLLRWYCWDGLYDMSTIQNAQGRLLGSYTYPVPGNVPPPGSERWHFNIWQANAGAPGWGRRVHGVHYKFEFTNQIIDFPGMGYGANQGLSRLLLEGPQLEGVTAQWDTPPEESLLGRGSKLLKAPARMLSSQAQQLSGGSQVGLPAAIGIGVAASALTALAALGVAFFVKSGASRDVAASIKTAATRARGAVSPTRRRQERVAPAS